MLATLILAHYFYSIGESSYGMLFLILSGVNALFNVIKVIALVLKHN